MSAPSRRWRFLDDPAADGAWNMSVDEALLEHAESRPGAFVPTLRLYGWDTPTVSLGRGQPFPPAHRAEAVPAGIDWVRRATGGLAVLHEHELTYSVVAATGRAPFDGGIADGFRAISGALVAFTRRLGLSADPEAESGRGRAPAEDVSCFDWRSRHEIAVGERKLIGSAQRRKRDAFLQHGSIPWRLDADRLREVLGTEVRESAFTDLARVTGGRVPPTRELRVFLAAAFAEAFQVEVVPGELTDAERQRAVELYAWKHLSIEWVAHGRAGEREGRWGPAWSL